MAEQGFGSKPAVRTRQSTLPKKWLKPVFGSIGCAVGVHAALSLN